MYTHTVTRLAYLPVLSLMFVSGICIGTMLGVIFSILDGESIGVVIITLLAFFLGILSGLLGLVFTAVFNLVAPAMGGIPLKCSPLPAVEQVDNPIQPSNSPL